jgi:Raf kinase inhibitor-like YbhB/YbcL family protein
MHDRRSVLRAVAGLGTIGVAGCSSLGGSENPPATTVTQTEGDGDESTATDALTITSPAFEDGATIPVEHTRDGEDVSPPLRISGVPDGIDSLALVADDPDAPDGPFVHWLLWDLSQSTTEIPEGIRQVRRVESLGGAKQGTNDFGELGYLGPAPPEGDGPHTYRFTLYAVESELNAQAGTGRTTLDRQLEGKVLTSARLTGEYERQS